ncbi:response regulator transcription factor [Pedobacter sp. MR2016-19]|uniref:response regulator transcription factor n=1 Tax=Pedobacter sp. MR2016-19 TaxID=2780089 RepID=UPI0018769B87|nr:response regulator transcription factor [Pedobacter sp. MR2016-19]MBE5320123.1 response regulator transcription factor [Pedobacter sp. MR2016-19]
MNILKDRNTINLGVVDDHNLFRKGLIKLINLGDTDKKYNILFEAESGLDLKEKLKKDELPDIILMDIDMPDMNGYEAIEWLQRIYPSINILVISMFETEEAVLRMLRLKVKGYLSKDIEVEDMHMALEAILHNGYYYSDFASAIISQSYTPLEGDDKKNMLHDKPSSFLSQKDRDFLQYVCSDMTYQQIAGKMFLSPKTIDGYRESLFQKCGVKSRVALALYAVKHGIVEL